MNMGAQTFYQWAKGASAREAFTAAREQAGYESGFGGYSGTVVEKHKFVIIPVSPGTTKREAEQIARKLVDDDDPRISDKWGPAGCIQIGDEYLFFGWASS